jgi:predicted nucleic acid-binding protein
LRYWDASALVAVMLEEPGTDLAGEWLASDDAVCTWALTWVELVSAIERRARAGAFTTAARRTLLTLAHELASASTEVLDVEAVRVRAVMILARHSLRAADALQLAAALIVAEGGFAGLPFVCLDRRLADAAAREGLDVLTWKEG